MREAEGEVIDDLGLLEGEECLVIAARRKQAFGVMESSIPLPPLFLILFATMKHSPDGLSSLAR